VVINATVTDPDSATHVVEFLANGTKLGEDTTSPYSFTASGLADGYYSLTVRVTDPDNLTVSSSSVPIQVGTPPPRALLVVGNPNGLSAGDTAAQTRLAGFGYEVVVIDDIVSQATDALLKEVVVIASSVASGDVGSKFRGVSVPVVSWEAFIQDDMLHTGPTQNTDFGTATGQSNVVIVSNHPLAGGLSGTVLVFNSPQDMGWGVTAPGATNIATLEGSPQQAVIYGFETGAVLADGGTLVPARRVHLFLTDNGLSVATPDGVKLFDAAMSWAVGRTLVVAPARPTLSFSKSGNQLTLSWPVSAGNFALKTSPVLTTNAGSWSSAGTPTVVGGNNQVTVFTTNNSAFYRLEQ
jgi:hypothetical protein